MKTLHNVEDMIGQFAAGAVRTTRTKGMCHVRHADAATHIITMRMRDFLPVFFIPVPYLQLAPEGVGQVRLMNLQSRKFRLAAGDDSRCQNW